MKVSIYQLISFFIILLFSLIFSWQDIKAQKIKVWLLWLSILCAFICQLICMRRDVWIYILTGLLAGLFYFIVRKISKDRLGLADVWFGIFQGLFLPPLLLPFCFAIESAAALLLNKKISRERFAFIPYMSFGLILSYVIYLISY